MSDTKDVVLGMKRALGVLKDCDGDLDFAIFVVERDIEALQRNDEEEESDTHE